MAVLIILAVVVASIIVWDQTTAVSPQWPDVRDSEPIPPRPQADDAPFHTEPFADSYEERKQAYLAYAAALDMPETRGGMYVNMAQMALDPTVMVADAPLQDALNHVNARNDTADFATSGLMRLYYGFPDRLTPAQKAAMNVWLVQMGRAAEDGSFADFVAAVSSAPLEIDGLDVVYESPGNGTVSFGWERPFTVNGQEIPLRGYPRFDNPYTQSAAFGTGVYEFVFDGDRLRLDFEESERVVE